MKLLDLNTHSWMEEEPYQKLEAIVDFIAQGDYDAITLQEVNQTIAQADWQADSFFAPVANQRPVKVDNFAKLIVEGLLARGLTYYWAWSDAHIGYDTYDEGVAILSKAPIKAQAVRVSQINDRTNLHTRIILLAQTQLDGRPVCLASGHFSWWQAGEKFLFAHEWEQTQTLLGQQHLPLVLMGDFNNPADTRNQGYDLIMASPLQLQDAFLSARRKDGEFTVAHEIDGWRDGTGNLRIDLAFYSQDFTITDYKVVFNGVNGPKVSDHFGLEIQAHWKA